MFPVQAGVSCIWKNDSQQFLLENFDIIHNSPFQLYHSALPFCPSSSWLHECYTAELLQVAKVVKGLPEEWEMCSRTALLKGCPWSLSYWNNIIAVGSTNKDILILDAITGSQTGVLLGHTDAVRSLTFSSDGALLASGSEDKTVKLWDVQTGGVVKTFCGHTDWVYSVSISADHTRIASGSKDKTIHLWDIQMGECYKIIEQQDEVYHVRFSHKNSQCLISVSGETVQQWDIDGHKVGPIYSGHGIAFSPNGTQFILHAGNEVIVHNINSRAVVAKFDIASSYIGFEDFYFMPFSPCCFSPDNRLAAAAAAFKICVWDITGSGPHLVETFVGHVAEIASLTFSSPSTLISSSQDESVKFWKIGASSIDQIVANPKPTPLTLALTRSITPKAKNGLIIPGDLPDGVMTTWGIATGLHNGSLQTPAQDSYQSNTQLIDNKLILVWYVDEKINIWDAEKGELLQTINVPGSVVKDLRVSGDGSKVFCVYKKSIQAWDIWTGEAVGKMRSQSKDSWIREAVEKMGAQGEEVNINAIDGSKIWVLVSVSRIGQMEGWDFGTGQFFSPEGPPDRLHLNDTKVWEISMSGMRDIVTGKVVVQIPGRFGEAIHAQWDGHYLVVSFLSKEVVVLNFGHVSS